MTLGPAHEFSLQDVKLSRIVIYRYKIIRNTEAGSTMEKCIVTQ